MFYQVRYPMRIINFMLMFLIAFSFVSCKKEKKDPEPGFVLQKWSKAIEELDYKKYSGCEAYPKSEKAFREMYKDDYFINITVIEVTEPEKDNIKKDHNGNSYINCSVKFNGSAIKRGKRDPYQAVKGDAVFIKFLDGAKSKNGWLIFNRTITRVNL